MASLTHSEPDRVPVDFGGHRSSGIAVQAYKNLRAYLGLPQSPLFVYDVVQQLAVIEDDVMDILQPDIVQLGCELYKRPNYWKPWRLHDGTEIQIPAFIDIAKRENGDYVIRNKNGLETSIQKANCLYFEQLHFPYCDSDEETFDDLEEAFEGVMWMHVACPPAPYSFEERGQMAKELRASTDRAIFGGFGGGLLEPGEWSFRMDNFLMELAADPDRVEAFLDKLLAMHMRNLEQFLEHVGPHIDIIGFGDDLGMQTGPLMSPRVYDALFKPRYAKMWRLVKETCPHLSINQHCCGSIHALLPSMIDAGLDSVNPVQTTCAMMEPERLKKDFGGRIAFWGGGCDTRTVLSKGTPRDVDENVKRNIETLASGGGFVFQQVHNVLADFPPENVVAMFEAVKKYGKY